MCKILICSLIIIMFLFAIEFNLISFAKRKVETDFYIKSSQFIANDKMLFLPITMANNYKC